MTNTTFGSAGDSLTYSIIGCAMKVHRTLGPGLQEAIYDDCMAVELKKANIDFKQHPAIRVPYEGKMLDRYYRPDFVIQDEVILEVKSVEHLLPVHQGQALTYMKLAGIERGLLINFNVALLSHGIKRLIMTKAPEGASVSR